MKNYRFLFDKQCGQYLGVTRDLPFADNTTEVEPYFSADYISVFDRALNEWKLVEREKFYSQISEVNKLRDYDTQALSEIAKIKVKLKEIGDSVLENRTLADNHLTSELAKMGWMLDQNRNQIIDAVNVAVIKIQVLDTKIKETQEDIHRTQTMILSYPKPFWWYFKILLSLVGLIKKDNQ